MNLYLNLKRERYIICPDDNPSSSEEVTLYGAKILNIKNLKKIEVNELESKMIKNLYKDSKKVSNKKLKKLF